MITSVTARIHPVPEAREYEGWRFASFAEGTAALRRLAQDGPQPTVLRLSDETETMIGLADPTAIGAGSPDGGPPASAWPCSGSRAPPGRSPTGGPRRRRRCARRAASRSAPSPARSWERGRFDAPYLRDALLDVGAFVETLETAAFWSGRPAAVRGRQRRR